MYYWIIKIIFPFSLLMVFSALSFANNQALTAPKPLEKKPLEVQELETQILTTPKDRVVNAPLVKTNSVPNTLPNYSSNLTEVILSLLLIIAIILILAWLLKRMGYANINQHQLMSIKSSLSLSNKEKLLLVQIGDEQVVIGMAPGSVNHIKTLEKPLNLDEGLSKKIAKQSFSQTFEKIIKGNKT